MKKRVLAFLLILILALPTALLSSCGDKNFGYMTSSLSKYVEIDPRAYIGLEITVNLDSVTDADVEESINQVRVANKNKTAENDAGCRRDVAISLGDVVNIYYRGYSLKDGVQTDLDGTCNFDGDVAVLEIGSRNFISGFESGLIGKVPQDYGTYQRRATTEKLKEGDVVQFTYSAIFPHSIATNESAKITFSESEKTGIDAQFGEGFYEFLKTVKPGDIIGQKEFPTEGGNVSYSSLNFTAAYALTGTPITVETYFPANYREPTLAAKTVYFDVYFSASAHGTVVYRTPDLDETYIKETLETTDEELAKYDGATIVDKYRNMVRDTLETTYRDEYSSAVYDAAMKKLLTMATFKKLPQSEVNKEYQDLLENLNADYETYCSYYGSDYDFDTFASAMTGLDSKGDYQSILKEKAENTVKEKLVFYAVARGTDLIPPDKELQALHDSIIDEYLTSYLDSDSAYDRGNFETDEEYEEARTAFLNRMIAFYGDEFFWESARYRTANGKIEAQLKVTRIGR